MNKITQEMLKAGHVNGEQISGLVLLQDSRRQMTKTKKPFFSGNIMSGISVPFKIWDNASAFTILANKSLDGQVVYISGTWNEYQGQLSVVIDTLIEYKEGQLTEVDFLPVKYNKEAYWSQLKGMVQKLVSPQAMEIANKVLFDNTEVAERFKTEFAAKSHHDNCPSGLLAHTFKLVYLAQVTISLYGDIINRDLFILGVLLHDIGKIHEMHFGAYQPCSKVTHRFLGIEMLDKEMIVKAYGEDGYYELVSILLQHHGEWGDPCKTVSARLVILIDEFEAKYMLIKQSVDESDNCGTVNVDGVYLSYMTKK